MTEKPKPVLNMWEEISQLIDPEYIKSVKDYGKDLSITRKDGMVIAIKNGAVAYRAHLLSRIYGQVLGFPFDTFEKMTQPLKLEQLNVLYDELLGIPSHERFEILRAYCLEIPSSPFDLVKPCTDTESVRERIPDEFSPLDDTPIGQLLKEKEAEEILRTGDDEYLELVEKGRKLRL